MVEHNLLQSGRRHLQYSHEPAFVDQFGLRQLEHLRSQCRPEIAESEEIARHHQVVTLSQEGCPDALLKQVLEEGS